MLCVKNTKATTVACECPGAESDPVSRLWEVWDCRKKPLSCPEMPAVTLNPLASEAEGGLGALQVEVRRLCAGQVCDYVSAVVVPTGVGVPWLLPLSESHRIMRLKYQSAVTMGQTGKTAFKIVLHRICYQ